MHNNLGLHRVAATFALTECLGAMSDQQIECGLTAFVDGRSTWTSCFFARALGGLDHVSDPYKYVAHALHVPVHYVELVVQVFDSYSPWLTKENLRRLVEEVRSQRTDRKVIDELLASLPTNTYDRAPRMEVTCA